MEYAQLGSIGMKVSRTPALVLRASAVQVSALAAWGSGMRRVGFTNGCSMRKTAARSLRKPSN